MTISVAKYEIAGSCYAPYPLPWDYHMDRHKRLTASAYGRWSRVWNLARYTNQAIYEAALVSLDERHVEILDVGCGTGLMARKLAATGRRVLGVDISPAMVARAGRGHSAEVEFIVADAEALPVATGKFDAVVNLISLHHYPNPGRAIAEFRRVLRPGGRLVLIAFDRKSRYIQLAQKTNRWTRSIAGTSWQKTGSEVLALVSEAGFMTTRLKPVPYWIKTFSIVAE